jgi:predicted enzyme related to lactoylglutathione lyase
MARVLGLGGVFWKSRDPQTLLAWYRDVLGLEVTGWGGVIFAPATMAAHEGAATVFAPFAADSDYFAPSEKPFMFNLAVDDLDGVLASCRAHDVSPIKVSDEANGRFAHMVDPEGTKIELWQPRAT